MNIRPLQFADNAVIEGIIRESLMEFGGNREGLAWADPNMSDLYHYYNSEAGRAYWVAEEDGRVLGGCGIAPFGGPESGSICELQKMYLSPASRGTGVAKALLQTALDYARQHYSKCYLETLQNMHAANRFYIKNGFELLEAPLAGSEHFACDAWYIKDLA
ncbi:GNAT family N-acetyltransferase [Paenibacillus sp. PK3_47]|uniref:GNAT family N-acetyltransferase n=1 Tax=Paenibacillus sp. PK3_47 TaxID=2072642 RepID=UPI00201E2430|nr:GNAT family N-acetyltransferase [Paenibacillus sp. PK3_47]UQZ36704.1 GNAT family N-acetyltransferase [Paenibacillus sp. PK3_47]